MKQLNVQIHPSRSQQLVVAAALARLRRLHSTVRVAKGEGEVPYIDIDFRADDLAKLWALVRQELVACVGLAESAIVVCEGQQGWDDYLLLHHYDSAVPLDDLG